MQASNVKNDQSAVYVGKVDRKWNEITKQMKHNIVMTKL